MSGQAKERSGTADLEICKGASWGEPGLAVFGGVVFPGEPKPGQSWRPGQCPRLAHGIYEGGGINPSGSITGEAQGGGSSRRSLKGELKIHRLARRG